MIRTYSQVASDFDLWQEYVDPDATMKILANYKNPNSPRGPIAIDPATRDIV